MELNFFCMTLRSLVIIFINLLMNSVFFQYFDYKVSHSLLWCTNRAKFFCFLFWLRRDFSISMSFKVFHYLYSCAFTKSNIHPYVSSWGDPAGCLYCIYDLILFLVCLTILLFIGRTMTIVLWGICNRCIQGHQEGEVSRMAVLSATTVCFKKTKIYYFHVSKLQFKKFDLYSGL